MSEKNIFMANNIWWTKHPSLSSQHLSKSYFIVLFDNGCNIEYIYPRQIRMNGRFTRYFEVWWLGRIFSLKNTPTKNMSQAPVLATNPPTAFCLLGAVKYANNNRYDYADKSACMRMIQLFSGSRTRCVWILKMHRKRRVFHLVNLELNFFICASIGCLFNDFRLSRSLTSLKANCFQKTTIQLCYIFINITNA